MNEKILEKLRKLDYRKTRNVIRNYLYKKVREIQNIYNFLKYMNTEIIFHARKPIEYQDDYLKYEVNRKEHFSLLHKLEDLVDEFDEEI